jgi:hypothetical protein
MSSRPRKLPNASPRSAAPRSWRAWLILGKEAQVFLGSVNAPDRTSAETAAVKAWNLDGEQRNRLVVQERL